MRSADTRLAALQQAYDAGHREIALMILGGTVRVYTRTPTSKPGWQINDYQHPYPSGIAAVVLVDAFVTGKPDGFYVVPIDDIRRIIMDGFDAAFPGGPASRPVSRGSMHAYVTVESVKQYRDRWRFYSAD